MDNFSIMPTTGNNETAEIDIIVPVYNTARYLDRCIASVVAQDMAAWRLILVDDGSTDDSPAICDRWAAQDQRITVVHKANSGPADSRNVAIGMCKASYVGFVDSDDWIEPDMYSSLLAMIKQHNADIALCNHFRETRNGSKCKHEDEGVEVLDSDEVNRLIIADRIKSYIWQMLFRRQCLDHDMPGHICFEDYAVLPHWFAGARRIVRTMRPLYHYRMRKGSVVHSVSLRQRYALFQAEKQRFDFYRNTPHAQLSATRLVHSGVSVAKYMARMKNQHAAKRRYIERIKKQIAAYSDKYKSRLSRKDRMLMLMLMKWTPLFIAYQRTEKLVMVNKRVSNRFYFE